jgi:predicted enzyme related to lactoylglutathione lyase
MKHANIIWFEIPVENLDRAVKFYSSMLGIAIEKQILLDTEYGVFKRENTGVGGVLVVKKNVVPGAGVILFFYVNVLSDAIEAACNNGGKVITPKTLIKQTDKDGNRTIAQNLIDNKVGYFAEMIDSEGNHISLYSNC